MRVFWSVLLLGLAACGFNPHPQNGALPCDSGCPSGYHCATDGTCRMTELGSGGVTASGGLIGSGEIAGGSGLGGSGGTTGMGGVVGSGGIVSTGGTVGGGGTIVPGLAVFAGVPSGQGTPDGIGAAARFNWPCGVAVDGTGNVFVSDTNSNTIRKITPMGVVTTLAGTAGSDGSADGTGAAARFNSPSGVAVDGAGNVFVADSNNNAIRKITPTGVVTTLAGTAGSAGSADGTAGPLHASASPLAWRWMARATSWSPTRATTPSGRSRLLAW